MNSPKVWFLLMVAALAGVGGGLYLTASSNPGAFLGPQTVRSGGPIAPPPEGDPQPKVEVVGGVEYDFGNMQVGETRRHTFRFKNAGAGVLKIKAGETSCKCTISDVENGDVQPGQETSVTLEWKPTEEASRFRKTAAIHTNDRTQPEVVLTVAGTVLRLLTINPDPLVFSQIVEGKAAEGTFTIHTPVDPTFQVTKLEFTDPETAGYFEYELSRTQAARLEELGAVAGWDVLVKIKPGLPLGLFKQRIKLFTSLKDAPSVEQLVQGQVVGEMTVVGGGEAWKKEHGVLMLGQVSRSQGSSLALKLLVRGKYKDLEAVEAETLPAGVLEVSISKRENYGKTGLIPIEVRVPKGAKPIVCSGVRKEPYAEVRFFAPGQRDQPLFKMMVQVVVTDD